MLDYRQDRRTKQFFTTPPIMAAAVHSNGNGKQQPRQEQANPKGQPVFNATNNQISPNEPTSVGRFARWLQCARCLADRAHGRLRHGRRRVVIADVPRCTTWCASTKQQTRILPPLPPAHTGTMHEPPHPPRTTTAQHKTAPRAESRRSSFCSPLAMPAQSLWWTAGMLTAPSADAPSAELDDPVDDRSWARTVRGGVRDAKVLWAPNRRPPRARQAGFKAASKQRGRQPCENNHNGARHCKSTSKASSVIAQPHPRSPTWSTEQAGQIG